MLQKLHASSTAAFERTDVKHVSASYRAAFPPVFEWLAVLGLPVFLQLVFWLLLLFGLLNAGPVHADTNPLQLVLTANPDPVRSGEQIFYRATVSNVGTVALNNVRLQLTTPNRVAIYRTQISTGGSCPDTAFASCQPGELITWPVGTLEPGASRTVQALATVASGTASGTLIQGRALADYDGSSASAARDVVVTSLSGLELGLVEDSVMTGRELSYTVTVSNRGSTAVTNALLTVPLPAGSSLVAAPNGGVLADGRVQWNLGTLPAGSGNQRQLRLRLADATPVGSVLVVSGEVWDGDNQNLARATAATVVQATQSLRLALTANPDPAWSEEKISYQVTVSNAGAVALHNVQLQLVTPNRVSIYRTQISAGVIVRGRFLPPVGRGNRSSGR